MDALAIEQAQQRLAKAVRSAAALASATNYLAAEDAWTDFLLAAATIYSKLEQGSKSNAKSQAWFGRKKKERRDDPLLRYLHHARNSDEHGIERVTEPSGPNTDLGGVRELAFNERRYVDLYMFELETKEPVGGKRNAVLAGPTLKPVRVHDRRFNDYCDPPESHRGQAIEFASFAIDIAAAAIPYLLELVLEAEGLALIPETSRDTHS